VGARPNRPKMKEREGVKGIPFSFSFLNFSNHFPKDFEFLFCIFK
jgi:hypothetical protein